MESQSKIFTWQLVWNGSAYAAAPLDLPGAPATLDEVSLQLPAGAYTTFRTYGHGGAMRFADHLARLADSAERARVPVGLHPTQLRTALGMLIRQSPFPEARVRISLDLTDHPGQLFVCLEELHLLPAAAFETGVRTISRVMHRDNPQAKLTNFIAIASGYRAQLPAGVNEMLMIDTAGVILEGLSSNFFGVTGGVLYTAEAGVLLGITRAVTLALARESGIAIGLSGLRYDQWPGMTECFITSASRGVLPVVHIDEHCIGDGHPGAVTQKLMWAFNAWVERETEEI